MRRQFPEEQVGWVRDVFEVLDGATVERLMSQGTRHRLEEGEVVPDLREALVRVETGFVKLALVGDDRSFTIGIFGPGDTVCSPMYHIWDRTLYRLTAEEASEVVVIPGDAVMAVAAEQPAFAQSLMRHLSWGTWHLMQTAQMLAFDTLPRRIARVLVNLAAVFGVQTPKGVQLGLRITQAELADLAGARRETLSAVLQELREHGILDLRYARINIRSMDLLLELAGSEPLPFLSRRGALGER